MLDFFGKKFEQFQKLQRKLWPIYLPEEKVILRDASTVRNRELRFLNSHSGFQYSSRHSFALNLSINFFGNRASGETTQILNVILSIIFHVTVEPANSVPFSTQVFLARFCFIIRVKNARPVSLEISVSFLLHLPFYETGIDEKVDTLHRCYLWLVYQCMPSAYTKFRFWNREVPLFPGIYMWQV